MPAFSKKVMKQRDQDIDDLYNMFDSSSYCKNTSIENPEDKYQKNWNYPDNFLDPFKKYIGQETTSIAIQIAIKSAIATKTAMGHMLMTGPSGFGKSEIAKTIIETMNVPTLYHTGLSLTAREIPHVVQSIQEAETFAILFIDEAHRINKKVAEEYYEIMQDCSYRGLKLKPFSIIACTTDAGLLHKSLRDRFRYTFEFKTYTDEQLKQILQIHHDIKDAEAEFIVARSKGVPRIALEHYNKIKDVANVYHDGEICLKACAYSMSLAGIGDDGLDQNDIRFLKALNGSDGPIGKAQLATLLDLSAVDIENVIEPYLSRCGMISRTPSGRVITPDGMAYLAKRRA